MEVKYDKEIDLENMNSIEILNKYYCFIIEQEYSKIIISLCKAPKHKHIYEYSRNREKIISNIFYAFIDYKKNVNNYEIIISLYNLYEISNNNGEYINYLSKLKRLINFNANKLNLKNLFKEMIYIELNSIFIKSIKFNILKDNLKEMTIIYEFEKNKNNNIK